ncbi:MAG: c-type cytochrome [Gammaproteobacteria bacterium]|nr:c-type cytochrome [Gammaproteobacteria bacterium]
MKHARSAARFAAAFAFVMASAMSAQAAAGQQAFAVCAACHGARGEGNAATGAPAIAGQQLAYLQRQLGNFRTGLRGTHKNDTYGAQMRAGALAVLQDEKAIAAVAAYVAALPATSIKPAVKFDARNGNNLYQGKCGACHGVKAEGNAALFAPRLAGLDAAYIERQFNNFRHGVRGAQPQDKYGRQMALMAATLTTERELVDVIGYIHANGVAVKP